MAEKAKQYVAELKESTKEYETIKEEAEKEFDKLRIQDLPQFSRNIQPQLQLWQTAVRAYA